MSIVFLVYCRSTVSALLCRRNRVHPMCGSWIFERRRDRLKLLLRVNLGRILLAI
jgi:hypothetical protein